MKRRHLLIGAGAVAAIGYTGWRFGTANGERALTRVIYKKLGYLKLDDAGVRQFAHDQVKLQTISAARLRIIDAVGPVYSMLSFQGRLGLEDTLRHGEDRIVTQYLMSTDFFRNGADQTRVVRYLEFYDPMVACGNPFARPPVDPNPA
jgi:hypothetical protein